jgi:hypothetical protein
MGAKRRPHIKASGREKDKEGENSWGEKGKQRIERGRVGEQI